MSVLKKKYAIWKWLSEFSGFSVTENGKIVADDACWDDLIELHKEEKEKLAFIKFFRKNALVHLDKMEEVFDGNMATGRFSRSSTENYDESEEEVNSEDEYDKDEDGENAKEEDGELESSFESSTASMTNGKNKKRGNSGELNRGGKKPEKPEKNKMVTILTSVLNELQKQSSIEKANLYFPGMYGNPFARASLRTFPS